MSEDTPHIPRHVAIIMDGNGRWARQRGWPRLKGHQEGAESVRAVMLAAPQAGIRYLTLYAFSTENWNRPPDEVDGLMKLLEGAITQQERKLHENQIRLRIIGRLGALPERLRNKLLHVMMETAGYDHFHLTIALSYGGRAELVDAARAIAHRVKSGELNPDDITEDTLTAHLYAPDIPDPDLMIRTSGEMRISNFLLWQSSYAELYISPVFWPDFREKELQEALAEYARRARRFGGL